MPAIPAGSLRRGHRVILPDAPEVKIVASAVDVLPTCISETFVTYVDGDTDQFCNFKNVVVESETPDAKVAKAR